MDVSRNSISPCQSPAEIFFHNPRKPLATQRMWMRFLLYFFTSHSPSSARTFRRSNADLLESPAKQIWKLQEDHITSEGRDIPFLALYDLSSRVPLLALVLAPEADDKRDETDWQTTAIHIENFIRTKHKKGAIESIFAVQAHGRDSRLSTYTKERGLQRIDGGLELRRHHLESDSFLIEKTIVEMKRQITRQLFALVAHNETQVLALWVELLERYFLTLPDPSHGQCSCICCSYRVWRLAPRVEAGDGKELTTVSVRDVTQEAEPAVVVVGCFSSGRRTDDEWVESYEQLHRHCQNISSNGGMGQLLYVAQAHGRLVRWYVYRPNIGMQDLDEDPGRLDVIEDVVTLNKLLGGLVEHALGMFSQ